MDEEIEAEKLKKGYSQEDSDENKFQIIDFVIDEETIREHTREQSPIRKEAP